MGRKSILVFSFLIFCLVLANLLLLDYFWFFSSPPSLSTSLLTESAAGDCGPACQQTIDEKIKTELAKKAPEAGQSSLSFSPTPTLFPTKVPQPTSAPKAKIVYIPLASSGSTVSTSWTDIVPSEFYFDLENYPLAKEVRFETYLLALHGSAKVYTRLYDQTNKRGVDYSQLETQSDAFVRLESAPVAIWRGNNQYSVQLRSENGTEVQLKDAKLKIVF